MFLDTYFLGGTILRHRNGELKRATVPVNPHVGKQVSEQLIRYGWLKKYSSLHYWRAQATSSYTCLAEFWCNLQGQHTSRIPYSHFSFVSGSFSGRSLFISIGPIWQKSHCLRGGRTAKLIRKHTSLALTQRNYVRRPSTYVRSYRRNKDCSHLWAWWRSELELSQTLGLQDLLATKHQICRSSLSTHSNSKQAALKKTQTLLTFSGLYLVRSTCASEVDIFILFTSKQRKKRHHREFESLWGISITPGTEVNHFWLQFLDCDLSGWQKDENRRKIWLFVV